MEDVKTGVRILREVTHVLVHKDSELVPTCVSVKVRAV